MNLKTSHVVGFIGKAFITTGLLLLGLVVYQLWGTGIETRRTQSALRQEFNRIIATTQPAIATTASAGTSAFLPVTDALALIEIPSINISKIIVEGITTKDLRRGPGHFPKTPLPGELGNSAIAGHRTSYDAPFGNLNTIALDDPIIITTPKGKFEYIVKEVSIVAPDETSVLKNTPRVATLTLVTCHPRFSTSQRLIVRAELSATSLPAAPTSTTTPPTPTTTPQVAQAVTPEVLPQADIDDLGGWFSDSGAIFPALMFGAILIALARSRKLLHSGISRRITSRITASITTYALLSIPFLVTLYYFYRHVNLLLPAGA
ncbi:MAG: sortase [Ilumatobacteraceae bacterium]|jgi:sortase A|nr:sortase [Ilumatobacteraceae bacterium]MDP5108901.1 sortase [Ilumatobacteraceae bacterium]